MSIGKNETALADFYETLVEDLFNRKCIHVHKHKEQTRRFTHKDLVDYLNASVGTSAYNKRVPEWIKQGSYGIKLAFLQGFLDSDGSVVKDRGKIRINFTSVNLELLEDIQDLLFGLQIKNSIVLHQKNTVNKYGIHSLQSYRINIAMDDNLKLTENPIFESRKIKIAKQSKNVGKSKINIKFVNDTIWLKVDNIDSSKYTGVVYNFECDTHTFGCRCIMTHNCDPLNASGV
jgi:intein/homing endonuclease